MSYEQIRRLPPIAGDTDSVSYRLLVSASQQGRKSFGWAIVYEGDNERIPLIQSLTPFRSLQEAHDAGVVALQELRSERARSEKRKG
jgi:hypothetical protein